MRPHFKTHQSKTVGHWFREVGIDRITVSSAGMAGYFAADGWQDITIAFPVNVREMETIVDLSSKVDLGLLVVDAWPIDILGQNLRNPYYLALK